jgi:hypothetical protein
MGSRWIRLSARALVVCVSGAVMAGCGGSKSTAPNPSERVNEYEPNANTRVVSQATFGDSDKETTVSAMRAGSDGSHVFAGRYNSHFGVGQLAPGGALRWFQPIAWRLRSVAALGAGSPVPNGLLAIGSEDTNGDVLSDVGHVELYSSSGALVAGVVVSDSFNVWFNDVTAVDESTFVACGGERHAGVEFPRVTVLHVRAPGAIEVGRAIAFPSPNYPFVQIITLSSTTGELRLAATSVVGTSRSLHSLAGPWPGLDSMTVEWSRTIATTGPTFGLEAIAESGGNLYAAGGVDDSRKPAPSGGGYWRSGWAASWTASGTPRWFTVDSLTRKSEWFNDIVVGSDAAYAVGVGAGYEFTNDPKDVFGYGLVARLDLATGHVLANLTLGDNRYEQGLNTAEWTSGGLIGAGWTGYETSLGPYRGWFLTVNASGAAPTTVAPAARDGRTAGRLEATPRRTRDVR